MWVTVQDLGQQWRNLHGDRAVLAGLGGSFSALMTVHDDTPHQTRGFHGR